VGATSQAPCQFNPAVSTGLSDIVMKCLQPDPQQRYQDGATLAGDLRRHLADEPLAGVRNRSPSERWSKWRRRRPNGLAVAVLLLAAITSLAIAAALWRERLDEPRRRSLELLQAGRDQLNAGHLEAAAETFEGVVRQADGISGAEATVADAERLRHEVLQTLGAQELGRLTDKIRFLYPFDGQSHSALAELESHCRAVWERRHFIREQLGTRRATADSARINADLLDLAIACAVLQARNDGGAKSAALAMLDEVEALFGPSAALARERLALGGPGGQAPPPRTAWDHYALGRALLRDGDLNAAATHLDIAAALEPESLWPVFYQGQCAFRRGRHRDAVVAFSVCIGRAPTVAACPFNRALAFAALNEGDAALADYERALALDPGLSAAYLNRGLLHRERKELQAAVGDLETALRAGGDPVAVYYDLALVHRERGDRAAALDCANRVLQLDPRHVPARELRDRLGPQTGR
jgi:tetratricopeptide (TPR) repeat protein